MKKLILSVCAIAIVAAIGCKSGGASSSDPKATLMNFFEAMSKKDLAAARKLATKESESMFSMMEMGMKMAENMKSKEADEFKKFEPGKMEFGETKIEGDKATVPVTYKDEKETANFILKKQDGAWKVAFDKASMSEMGGEKMKDSGVDAMNEAGEDVNVNAEDMQKGMQALDSMMKDPKMKEMLENMQKKDEN